MAALVLGDGWCWLRVLVGIDLWREMVDVIVKDQVADEDLGKDTSYQVK